MRSPLPSSPRRQWTRYWRELTACAALGGAALLALAAAGQATPAFPEMFGLGHASTITDADLAPPQPLDMQVRDVSAQDAIAINAGIPADAGQTMAAPRFSLGSASPVERARATECLTSAIYYEAANEPDTGQRAVAQVVLNRVRHPAFPDSVCGVVYQGSTHSTGCQFTFTCDGSMERRPEPALWDRARKVAEAALAGQVYAPVGEATHYHANYVVPYWAATQAKIGAVGAHIFYRWPGSWGQPSAFTQHWSGHEPDPAALRFAALSAPHLAPAQNAAVAQLASTGFDISASDGRVRAHFTPAARQAVEKVAAEARPYVDRVAASDNLRYALEGAPAEVEQPAFGKPAGNGS